ncbi:MAG: glutathione S-transferase family protein [Steroidobacteraceae bacterium]
MIARISAAALAALLALAVGPASAAETRLAASAAPPQLTIYHIEGRRSERLVWLCEELGLPYKLEFKKGDVPGSMQTIRQVSPLMPVAPTVRYGDQVMVESGAIIELLLDRHAKGKLAPAVDSPDYLSYLQWMHFAEGSAASRFIADYRVATIQGRPKPNAQGFRFVDSDAVLKFADDFLSRNAYFGGKEFSAADIMMLFPVNLAGALNIVELSAYPNVVAWRQKVESRPAYKKMVEVARPNGVPMPPPALPKAQTG